MAAPSTTARGTPSGIYLPDGFSTKIAPAADPTVSFWEKQVKPPGLDGGEKIDTTTMHNTRWRTANPRALITLTDGDVTAAYDPALYTSILNLINVRTSWTVRFPDGSTLDFFGFLQKFEPASLAEGTFPECTLTICPTNYDPTNHVESSPVLTSVAGT